jgi:predicted phosphate transport protein (TIGR00153 family)
MPRKSIFFTYMEASAAKAVEIVDAFQGLLDHFEEAEQRFNQIREIEHAADEILHKNLADLRRSFVTPLDHNDIATISKRLDDIVDLVEGSAQRMYHYDLREAPPPLRKLVDILLRQVRAVRTAVIGLSRIRDPEGMHELIVEINTLENEADHVLRASIGDLFREETDPRTLIKWKEVYEHLEKATDRCEDVADHIENILLEYA